MKFFEIKIINDVKSTSHDFFDYIIKSGLILYIDSKSVIRVLDVKKFEVIFQESLNCIPFIQFCSGRIYLRNPDDTLFYLDYQNGSIALIYKALGENDFEVSVGLVSDYIILERHAKYENYICVDQKILVKEIETGYVKYSSNENINLFKIECDQFYYFQSEDQLSLYKLDIETNKKVWSFDFAFKPFSNRVIVDNKNYFILQGGQIDANDRNSLKKVDKLNGKEIWQCNNTTYFYNFDEYFNSMFGLSGSTFEIINVETGEREMLKELDLQVPAHLTYYADGYLYFSGYKGDNVTRIFGAVDVNTGEIAFTQSIEMPNGVTYRESYDRPVVVGNRLYIRDQSKTLHIYERQK